MSCPWRRRGFASSLCAPCLCSWWATECVAFDLRLQAAFLSTRRVSSLVPCVHPCHFSFFFSFLYFLSGSGCLKVLFKCWLPEQFLVIEALNLTEHSFLPYYYHKATMYSFFFSLPFIFPRTHNVQLQHKKKKSPLCSLFFYEFLCICAKTNKQTRRRLAWSKTQYEIWCLLVFCWPSFLFFFPSLFHLTLRSTWLN